MFILLNGAFGIGKTTTARALVTQIAGAAIYDPEPLGMLMQRAMPLIGRPRVEDFQDLPLWHRAMPMMARRQHRSAAVVIIPMAFSNLRYFEKLGDALRATAPVVTFCLVASLAEVQDRLCRRAHSKGRQPSSWELRRAVQCCMAHTSPAFGSAIDANASTADIVRAVLAAMA